MELAVYCPEERKLVHGDFGSNNVLADGRQITAVIDWDNALYGDPLYDVAGAYFWSTWLMCMEKSARYWDTTLASLPSYRDRIQCYQLNVGLREIYDNACDGDVEMLAWLHVRCRELLT